MKNTVRLIISITAFCCLVACERRPLDVLTTGLRIELTDDYSLPHEPPTEIPEHYRVNMYDRQSGDLVYQDIVKEKGGSIRSVPGDYLCFVCNFDEGHLIIKGEDNMNTFYLTAPEAEDYYNNLLKECKSKLHEKMKSQGEASAEENGLFSDDQVVLDVSDYFWTGSKEVNVPALGETDDEYIIPVNVKSALNQGKINIKNIKGQEYIVSINCFVTNLCAGMNPVTGALDTTAVAETFKLHFTDSVAHGTFLYFGETEKEREIHLLYVLVTDSGGGHYLFVQDLGALDSEEDMEYNIDLDIDIPEPDPQGGGGFQPTVDDWDVEYIPIVI